MRFAAASVIALALLAYPARALEFSGTCRGASATVIEVEGFDTAQARVSAKYTMPDAISYCHYSLGSAQGNKSPTAAATRRCAQEFMQQSGSAVLQATANCKKGTLSYSPSRTYKFPIDAACGDDNNQAISVFRMLCPSYEGQVETQ